MRRGAPRHPAARRPPGERGPPRGAPSGVRHGAASTRAEPPAPPGASGTAPQGSAGRRADEGPRSSQRHDARDGVRHRRTTFPPGRTLSCGVTRCLTTNRGTRQSSRNAPHHDNRRWRFLELSGARHPARSRELRRRSHSFPGGELRAYVEGQLASVHLPLLGGERHGVANHLRTHGARIARAPRRAAETAVCPSARSQIPTRAK